jgi:hypothetical protein
LNFNLATTPAGERVSLSAQLEQVDNARERVDRNGLIHGVRATGSLCYRASGYIRTALEWEIHAELAEWFFRALIVQLPEPEIYYPPGVEMTLKLTEPLVVSGPAPAQGTPTLTETERANLEPFIEQLPFRTTSLSGRPSDLINVLFIGSRDQVQRAFTAAGWMPPEPVTMRARIRDIRAVAERAGYRRAPMSALLLENAGPDMSWQKGLNDLSKRHHIRIWKQPETWHGQELWAAAATRDLDFAFFRPGQLFTHRVERNVDQERDKVADDLVFASCVDAVDSMRREDAPQLTYNSTGDPMRTDARLAIVRLKDCANPAPFEPAPKLLPMHGGKWQRFVRREILSMRSDLLRTNIYYRVYEGARLGVEALIRRARNRAEEPPAALRPAPPIPNRAVSPSAASHRSPA